jgi:transposase-like protein
MATKKKTRRPRRTFTDEFKQGAVALAVEKRKIVAETARNLDVAESVLRGWTKQAEADLSGGKTSGRCESSFTDGGYHAPNCHGVLRSVTGSEDEEVAAPALLPLNRP